MVPQRDQIKIIKIDSDSKVTIIQIGKNVDSKVNIPTSTQSINFNVKAKKAVEHKPVVSPVQKKGK